MKRIKQSCDLKMFMYLKHKLVALTRKISEIFVTYRELIHKNRLNNSEGLVKAEIIAGEREKVNELWEIAFRNCPKKIRPLNQIHSKLQ